MKKKGLKFGSVCLSIATLTSAMATAPLSLANNNVVVQEQYALGDLTDQIDEKLYEDKVISSVAEYYDSFESDDSYSAPKATGLPTSVDNSTSKYFPKVDTQGPVGSCVCWAQVYYQYTYTVNKARNVKTTTANTYSPEWMYNLVNRGKDGGSNADTVGKVLQIQGATTLTQVPVTYEDYKSWHPDEQSWVSSLNNRIKDYQIFDDIGDSKTRITSANDSDLDLIKTALSNGELLTYSTDNPNEGESWDYDTLKVPTKTNGYSVDNSYVGQYVVKSNKTSLNGSHRMTLVGYNDKIWTDINGNGEVDAGEMGAFKVVNSWGDWWKNDGFCWVAYDALNSASVVNSTNDPERLPIFRTIMRIEADTQAGSGIYLKYTLNSAYRGETPLTVTAKKDGETVASKQISPYNSAIAMIYNTDQHCSYDGKEEANDGTMAFDLNNVIKDLNSANFNDYDWSVTVEDQRKNDTALTVKNMSIVDSNIGEEYAMTSESFTLNGESATKYFFVPVKELKASVSVTPKTNVGLYEKVDVKTSISGGQGPYQYKYTYTRYGQTFLISDYSSNDTIQYQLPEMGPYAIQVTVKDSAGNTASSVDSVFVNTTYIMSLTPNKTSVNVGEKVKFTPEMLSLASVMNSKNFKYTATKDGKTETFTTNTDKSGTWTPKESGTYQIKLELVYDSKTLMSRTIDYTVYDDSENAVTIYYKGYSTPYIHYQVGSGSWTTAPGVAMTPTSEVSGYTHKYTIDLGSASSANVCFNDGKGSWDSRNGSNYQFKNGTYTFSNGTISAYSNPSEDLRVSAKLTPIGTNNKVGIYENVTIAATAKGGKAPYQYQYSYVTFTNKNETILSDYSSNSSIQKQFDSINSYEIIVRVKDADGKIATTSADLQVSPSYIEAINPDKLNASAGEKINLTAETNNLASVMTASNYHYSVTKDGKTQTLTTKSDKSADWTPSEEGTYKIVLEIVYNSKTVVSRSMNYTVAKAPENQITIYYKGYSTPYIHYQVGNGSWTSVPGEAMISTGEVSGYTHKYTINLGTASYANVCFNDGKGSWDSKNGSNYYFTKGTYTYSNGTITKR